LLEPLLLLALLFALLNRRKLRAAFTLNRTIVVRAMLFAIGAVAAYLPVIIATMRGKVIESYGLSVPGMPLQGVAEHVVMVVRSDLWLFVGAAASVIVIPAFMAAMLRRPPLSIPAATIILCTIFYLFSRRAHSGAMRYIV